jgi:hypothetical protein
MRSLTFKSLQLLSEREMKGRTVNFHPRRNLILGMNHVGKSTVTKLILETLGAIPYGKLDRWDTAAISLLTLTVNDQDFQILRQRSNRSLFTSEGELLAVAARDGEWAQALANLVDFNLVLGDKNENIVQADAACMFLPFYINQDGGWSGQWHAFTGMFRFRSPHKSIVEYFTQIFPPQFYLAKAESDVASKELVSVETELRILNRTRDRLAKSIDIVGPKLTAEAFEIEIKEITRQLTSLNAKQEALRSQAVSLQEGLNSLDHQIALTTDVLVRYKQDFKYLSKPDQEELVCPTCGAHHEESFLSILNFAEDARAVSEMLIRLQESRVLLRNSLVQSNRERTEIAERYKGLQDILEVKRGELQFGDVVKSLGSGAALEAFDLEDRSLEDLRTKHLLSVDKWDREMKIYRKPKRKKEIKLAFQSEYMKARMALNLPSRDVSKMQVSDRPDVSGSAGPREVLAYYAALWWVSRLPQFDSPFSVPIIVDCPAQSGQDKVNLPAMLKFISTGLPAEAQVLLTYEDDVAEEFDSRLKFDKQYSLLTESEFEQVSGSIMPKMQMMRSALLQRTQTAQPTLFNT